MVEIIYLFVIFHLQNKNVIFICLYFLYNDELQVISLLFFTILSDCCLMPTLQFFSYIKARTSKFSTHLVGFFIAHWNKSLRIDMSPYPDSGPTSLHSFSVMLSREATNTNFIVFGLTRSGLKPTIYRTREEHANYYSTSAKTKE